MSEYEDMTNADVMSPAELYEYDRDAEFRLDAEEEARQAAEIAAEEAAEEAADDEETFRDCGGYSPDTWCGICEACDEARAEEEELYGPVC